MLENLDFDTNIMMKSKIFAGFSQKDCLYLHKIIKPRNKCLEKGEILINEEETVNKIFIISKGNIAGIKFFYEGNTHLVRTYHTFEALGVEGFSSTFKTSPLTYVALETSEVLAIPLKENFSDLDEKTKLQLLKNMLNVLADDNIKLLYKTEVLSKRLLRDRIITYLQIISKKRGLNNFAIMMNQEQFSQYLCVNRSALSNELNLMKKERLIDFEKDEFKILSKIT